MAVKAGTAYVELVLNDQIYKQKLSENLTSTQTTAKGMETTWKTLGAKTDAQYDAMRRSYENAMTLIKNSATSTAQDIIRAEEAKNAKIKALNDQQYSHHKTTMQKITDSTMAQFSAAVIGANLAIRAIDALGTAITGTFAKGFQAVEDYNMSIASMAAMVVTFGEKQKGVSLAEQWKGALEYSSAIVPILEKIAAKTILSGRETTALAEAFARSGVFLDATNSKQVESFTRISNALPMMTKGQEIMKQINTEIRAVMTGSNEQTSMMLQTLKAVDPEIEKHLKTWRAEGTVLEHIGDLLVGFGPATELLEKQWQTVKTTLDTTATQILRGLMKPAYESIIESATTLNKKLEDNKENILDWGIRFRIGAISVQAEVMRLAMLLDKVGGSMTAAKMLLYGPGSALGIESSTKRFQAAADANMEYEKRYKDTDKALEALALKQIKLEESLTAAAKARAAAEQGTGKAPKGSKGNQEDEKEAAIRKNNLMAMTASNKEYYDEATAMSEHWLKMQKISGDSDLQSTIEMFWNKKIALNEWYDAQALAIETHITKASEKNKALSQLDRDYNKSWVKIGNDQAEAIAIKDEIHLHRGKGRAVGSPLAFPVFFRLLLCEDLFPFVGPDKEIITRDIVYAVLCPRYGVPPDDTAEVAKGGIVTGG